jgi:hypothetical protein
LNSLHDLFSSVGVKGKQKEESLHPINEDSDCCFRNSTNKQTTTTTTTRMNRSIGLLLLIIASCLAITAFGAKRSVKTGLQCGQFQCPSGDQCCYNNYIGIYRQQCYNPYTHSCTADEYKPGQNCLCGKSDGCCNQVCYDKQLYYCDYGKIKLKTTPPPATCGPLQCPYGNQCCTNNIIGPYPQRCYSPNTHVCIPDEYQPYKNCLCGKYDGCCKGVCYDKGLYKCYNGQIKLKYQ